jgi:hypothetical protein
MTTPDIIMSIFGGILTLGLGIIIYNQREQTIELDVVKSATIESAVLLKNLPIAEMKADIKSNRHKIATMDKGLVETSSRVTSVEKTLDDIRGFCKDTHGCNL